MNNAIKREPCKPICRWPSVSILCNKRTIITCLRGTIGRWLKGKAIAIPVLAIIVPFSPWRGVRGEAAEQAF